MALPFSVMLRLDKAFSGVVLKNGYSFKYGTEIIFYPGIEQSE